MTGKIAHFGEGRGKMANSGSFPPTSVRSFSSLKQGEDETMKIQVLCLPKPHDFPWPCSSPP